MRYVIQEKFWSLGNKFFISDDQENQAYYVEGKAFAWGSKLSFQDLQGNELAYISQKLFSLKPRYRIYRNDELFAQVVKEYSWFKKKFTLDVPGPNDYTVTGSFWDHEYVFERGSEVVATVSKKVWSVRDFYSIDIVEGEDDISILCTAIVIDQVLSDEASASGGAGVG